MTLAPTGSQAARKLFAPLAWRFIDLATVVVPPCSSGVRYEKRSSISIGPTFKAYEVSWRLGGEGSPGSPGVTLQPDYGGSPALTAHRGQTRLRIFSCRHGDLMGASGGVSRVHVNPAHNRFIPDDPTSGLRPPHFRSHTPVVVSR